MKLFRNPQMLPCLLASLLLLLSCSGGEPDGSSMQGWEKESRYNRLYLPKEMDRIKGMVVDIRTVVPMEGMSEGVAVELQESKTETVLVHVCPVSFAGPGDIGIKRGEKVKIKGVWAEIDGKDVFMASKIKKGDHFEFKVRLTSDGTPFWTMTPQQLEKEKNPS